MKTRFKCSILEYIDYNSSSSIGNSMINSSRQLKRDEIALFKIGHFQNEFQENIFTVLKLFAKNIFAKKKIFLKSVFRKSSIFILEKFLNRAKKNHNKILKKPTSFSLKL